MSMSRAQKEAEVKELNERFSNDETVVFDDYCWHGKRVIGRER